MFLHYQFETIANYDSKVPLSRNFTNLYQILFLLSCCALINYVLFINNYIIRTLISHLMIDFDVTNLWLLTYQNNMNKKLEKTWSYNFVDLTEILSIFEILRMSLLSLLRRLPHLHALIEYAVKDIVKMLDQCQGRKIEQYPLNFMINKWNIQSLTVVVQTNKFRKI